MLSDRHIVDAIAKEQLNITGYENFSEQLQPASFDFHLGKEIAKFDESDPNKQKTVPKQIDVKNTRDQSDENVLYKCLGLPESGYTLKAGSSVLGHTQERLELGSQTVAEVTGRSTLGRCFITVHATAGFIDPGFKGQVTLEITNLGSKDFVIYPGMRIGQFMFDTLSSSCENKYGEESNSHYQDQEGVTLPNLEGLMP
jgi:dCTP deaminase